MKLSYEDKIDIVKAIDNGISNVFELSKIYDKSSNGIYYIYDLYKRHGTKVLQQHYISHSIEIKETIVKRIKNGESGYNLGIEFGLSNAEIIYPWIKNYDENYGKILVKKRGRKMKNKITVDKNFPKTSKETLSFSKIIKDKSYNDLKKENKELKRKLEYDRTEIAYLKKLDALVQARIKREQKKK